MAERLREERSKLEPSQGKFAQRIGISPGKFGHLETGRSELRARDLAAIAGAGIDIHYVVTGERGDGRLPPDQSELVTLFARLDPSLSAATLGFVRQVAGGPQPASPPAPLPEPGALAEAFEGALASLKDLKGRALAQALAQHLPIVLDLAGRARAAEEDEAQDAA